MRIPPRLKGFTLVELMIYIGILALMSGFLIGILMTTVQVGERESASAEVTSQVNFVMQTIQRLVRESSNIDIPTNQVTSTLVLRMASSSREPTIISLASGAIQIREGAASSTLLTNEKVVVNDLSFKKLTQYPARDTVTIDIAMTYNSGNPTSQVSRSLHSAVARASAATFDDNLVPTGDAIYDVGLSNPRWRNGFFSGNLNIGGALYTGGNVGIGTASPNARLQVNGGNIYVSGADKGIILKSSGGVCSRIGIDNNGAITTSTVACP